MVAPLKTFNVFVQFDSQDIQVKARNPREAKKKAFLKLSRKPAAKIADRKNCFVDEV